MRLFEIDLGYARQVLSVIRGQARKYQQDLTIPFADLQNILKSFGYALGNGDSQSVELLKKLKNDIDPTGKIIADVTNDASLVLVSGDQTADTQNDTATGAGPSVDQMASRNLDISK